MTPDVAEPADSNVGSDGLAEARNSQPGSADADLAVRGNGPVKDAVGALSANFEYAERAPVVSEWIDWARNRDLATDKRYVADPQRAIWVRERRDAHDAIVDDLYNAAADVPCERKAIIAGGLGGAGKSTVLDNHAGIDQAKYLTINPDDIKEEMAKRGLIPEIGELSPMEASDLVHEESSHVAKMLARRATHDGRNMIWDITMSGAQGALQRLDALDGAGYSTTGVFVDISIDAAIERAAGRHRSGHERYREGTGYGGRYVSPELISAQADPDWGSINRRVFEQVKPRFTDWVIYDNSVTGREPQLVEASTSWRLEEEER